MDRWSEDSSDEYIRAEQEAVLYSLVHHTPVEAASGTQPRDPSLFLKSSPQLVTPHLNNDPSIYKIKNSNSSETGNVNKHISRFFANIPQFLNIIKEQNKTSIGAVENANIEGARVEKNQPKSLYFERLSQQLGNVSRPATFVEDDNVNSPSINPQISGNTEPPLITLNNETKFQNKILRHEGHTISSDKLSRKSLMAEKKKLESNSPEHPARTNCIKVDITANTPQKIDSTSDQTKSFSFNLSNLNVASPVGNNLFSPFNTQYLESKTSSKPVFRLDERLFSDEKQSKATNLQKPTSDLLEVEHMGLNPESTPVLTRGSTECDSTKAGISTNIVQQKTFIDAGLGKTEVQKAFSFDLLHLSASKNTNLFSSFNTKYLESKTTPKNIFRLGQRLFSEDKNLKIKLKTPIRAQSNSDIVITGVKSRPILATKLSKKMKTKKKLKIVKSNLLYNSIINLDGPADKVMVIGLKSPDLGCDVIVVDKCVGGITSIDPDVIILDSDSDESVQVVPTPAAPLPTIISVEDSSDDDRVVRVRPAVVVPFETDPDVVENSFDFLDNVIENCMGDFDGLRKAQANVLSNLISNHSSKESLVDERLFQVESTVPQGGISKAKGLPYQDDNVSSSTSSASPVLENEQSAQLVGHLESGSDTAEPQTPHSFKVPKSKVRTKSRQARKANDLRAALDVAVIPCSDGIADANDDDIMIVHSGTKSTLTIEQIIAGETKTDRNDEEVTASALQNPSSRKRKRDEPNTKEVSKKKKKPGSKKRAKAEKTLQKLMRSHARSNLHTYTKIAGDELVSKEQTPSRSPPTWTKEMKRFYNSSWGGENFDSKEVRANMSGNPNLWRVSNEDRYPQNSAGRRASRCRRCQRSGHLAWACPENQTGSKCRICGQKGHLLSHCPNSVCLKCGQPSREFVKTCWQCKGSPFSDCPLCVWQHNPAHPCRNYRDRPVGMRPHASSNAGYKGYRQRYGNSHPAERGLSPYFNKNFSRRPYR